MKEHMEKEFKGLQQIKKQRAGVSAAELTAIRSRVKARVEEKLSVTRTAPSSSALRKRALLLCALALLVLCCCGFYAFILGSGKGAGNTLISEASSATSAPAASSSQESGSTNSSYAPPGDAKSESASAASAGSASEQTQTSTSSGTSIGSSTAASASSSSAATAVSTSALPNLILSSVSAGANWVDVSWAHNGVSAPNGFKVVWSTSQNPTYETAQSKFIGQPSADYTYLSLADGQKYYIRVCRVAGASCDRYSNQLSVNTNVGNPVATIPSLTHDGGGTISWTTTGGAGYGFVVAWDKNYNQPQYPSHHWKGSPTKTTTIDAWDGPGTYYVRVCSWDGKGSCDKFSPVITVTF